MPRGTLVLCYHNIAPDGTSRELLEAQLAVPYSGFASQLRYLTRRYQIITLDEVERGNGSRNALVLTFDDGYKAIAEFALPLVERYKIPAYLFVNPAFVGSWNPRDKLMALALYGSPRAVRHVEEFLGTTMGAGDLVARARRFVVWRGPMWRAIAQRGASSLEDIDALFARHADEAIIRRLEPSRLLSWDDLAALQRQGFRIGNHTQRHLELDALPRETVRSEVRQAQHLFRQRLGQDEPVISYPRGKTSAVVLEEAAAAGYRWGLTTVPGRIYDRQPTLEAPRVVVSPQVGIPELIWKTSRFRFWARHLKPLDA